MHVALRGSVELLGAVEARNVTPTIQVVQFGGCEVDRLPVVRCVIVFDEGFWNMGSNSMFTMLAQPTPIAEDSPSREERHWVEESGKLGCWRGRKSQGFVGGYILSGGGILRSATWPSEPTPAHVLRTPAVGARAGADMRSAAVLAALSLV